MSKAPTHREKVNGSFSLDRREFITAGLVLAAAAAFPRIAASAPASLPLAIARRKLGALEVSAIGLGCMSMNSGNDMASLKV